MTMKKARVSRLLLIESHLETRKFLETMLAKEHEIITAENGVIGVEYARNRSPDLILLDTALPILSGLDACSLLKQDPRTKNTPILMTSLKNTQADITNGLKQGADAYLTKPFSFDELKAVIQNLLKVRVSPEETQIELGDLKISPTQREAHYSGKKIKLTGTEFDLLKCLAVRAGNVVSREEILQEVWKEESNQTGNRTIDVHVRSLRKKIPQLSRHLTSIYGVGYRYER